MVTPDLIDFLKSQLANGQTIDGLRPLIIEKGWQMGDVEEALRSIITETQPALETYPVVRPHRNNVSIIVGIITLLIFFVGGGIFVYFRLTRNTNNVSPAASTKTFSENTTTTNTLSPTKQTSESQMRKTAPEVENLDKSENTMIYIDPEQRYSFNYISSWKLENILTGTQVTSPETLNKTAYKDGQIGDAVIAVVPYREAIKTTPGVTVTGVPTPKPLVDQVKDFASQMADGKPVNSVSVGDYKGYAVTKLSPVGGTTTISVSGNLINNQTSSTTTGNVLTIDTVTILLQGNKNMLFLNFFGSKSIDSLAPGQQLILNSLKEL